VSAKTSQQEGTAVKKVPVVKLAECEEAARLADLPLEATVALCDVAGAIKEGLLAFSCAAGLLVMGQLMEQEVTEKVGLKGKSPPRNYLVVVCLLRGRSGVPAMV
jgi:hypothetical protein